MPSSIGRNVPMGIKLVISLGTKCFPRRTFNRVTWFRCGVLGLTFFAYTLYHMSRKPISVVKGKLLHNCSAQDRPPNVDIHNDYWCDWAPFDNENATKLFGYLESYFLLAYAFAMFGSGYVAERVNLRYFLALGMIFSGTSAYMFGLAHTLQIHNLWFFVLVQIFGGIVQTSGWPGVVTVVGNWFGKNKRGLIFGVWNSHTSLGNILGTLIAGFYVKTDWGLSFIIPGLLIGLGGIIIFFFLPPHPSVVGCPNPNLTRGPEEDSINQTPRRVRGQTSSDEWNNAPEEDVSSAGDASTSREHNMESSCLLSKENKNDGYHRNAIGFWEACRIPGVLEFSFSLFFTKFVNYTFLFWLPLYIKNTTTLDAKNSAVLSTFFDIGGIFGGILAGVVSDATGMSASTCGGMLVAAVPMLFIYQKYGLYSYYGNAILLFITGLTVNGPYALITTAVSAELGTHHMLEGNERALSTVTAIIDGTGSLGAAAGPFVAGLLAGGSSWSNVFYVLMAANVMALLLLLRLIVMEYKRFVRTRHASWTA